ncbi:hypothetical protein [Nesterenkonia flava]|uniref:Uncharacterized protein n=1 Tax=Nesterenkonia flava TaxID=469799 RepID=A0ABU1FQL2_9MICC|nr:hypothetical protein [Nesterenkonia flava]MDR5710931.1 hypothetical protein [Nesterenkonia flava]
MTETLSAKTTHPLWLKATGLGAAALLALTACADDNGDGNGTDDTDADVTQDETPDEVSGDATEDTDAPADEQTEEPASDEAPALSEIEDRIGELANEAESVTVTAEISMVGGAANDDLDDEDDTDNDTDADEVEDAGDAEDELEQQLDGEQMSMVMRGSPDGSLAEVDVSMDGMDLNALVIDQQMYISGESMADTFEQQLTEQDLEQIDFEGFRSEVEGSWLDLGEDENLGGFEDMLDELDNEESWSEDFNDEGTVDERDGQEVWVYEGNNGEELVIVADEENPYIHSLTGEAEDGYFEMVFSDWDETDLPEAPADEDVLTEDEFNELLMQYIQ